MTAQMDQVSDGHNDTSSIDIANELGSLFYFNNTNNNDDDGNDTDQYKNKQRSSMDGKVKKLTRQDLTFVRKGIEVSLDPHKVCAGRGLINASNQPIQRGQLLFVTPATVAVDIRQVLRIFKSGSGGANRQKPSTENEPTTTTTTTRLEQISETILLKQMKRHVKNHLANDNKDRSSDDTAIASSFLTLTNGNMNDPRRYYANNIAESNSDLDRNNNNNVLQKALLTLPSQQPQNSQNESLPSSSDAHASDESASLLDDDYLRQIIRHNAFGPDFHSYQRMEHELTTTTTTTSGGRGTTTTSLYPRILAHYPFAAMINHSCTSNAQRVYVQYNDDQNNNNSNNNDKPIEVMIVTASKTIQPNDEILWSYIPPIVECQTRRSILQQNFGFVCHCTRCELESKSKQIITTNCDSSSSDPLKTLRLFNQPGIPISNNNLNVVVPSQQEWNMMIQTLDKYLKTYDNVTGRSLRLGWTYFYLNYFNVMLQQNGGSVVVDDVIIMEALKLHFSFVEVHNACTEHLSILHMCYDLVSLSSSSSASDNNNNTKRRTMFVEALKNAHISRYSEVAFAFSMTTGGGTDRLRAMMGHTKLILRNQHGWHMAAERIMEQQRIARARDQGTTTSNPGGISVKALTI